MWPLEGVVFATTAMLTDKTCGTGPWNIWDPPGDIGMSARHWTYSSYLKIYFQILNGNLD